MENQALRIIFSLFVGVLFALLVAFGIQAFYPQPELLPSMGTADDYGSYRLALEAYNRVVSAVIAGIAFVPIAVSAVAPTRAAVIADGILYGGLFTLLYAAGRGVASAETAGSFAAVAGVLLAALALGHVLTQGWPWKRVRWLRRAPTGGDRAALTVIFPLIAGVLITFSASLGIQSFYPPPEPPYGPAEQSGQAFVDATALYGRNLGVIATIVGFLLLATGFVFARTSPITSDSLFSGGLFTLIFAAVRSTGSHSALSFYVVAAGYLIALAAGHLRLAEVRWRLRRAAKAPASRMLALVFPLGAGVLTVAAFELGIDAYYPSPSGGPVSAWARTVSVIATVVAVVLWAASFALGKASPSSANALLLGGLLSLVFGVVPAAMTGQQATVFIALAVALAVVLFVGYRRFADRQHRRTPPTPPTPPAITA
ncbi:hypothetical protein SPF06_06025 [Sinomonas sp. JGH33]|uniref:DUF998 domain-containing protein n=1 Tax=Sinomonas terricola TaxID=3110330 RepID=A0ABU5T3Q1_9MICC|nr:hypothetical protein [Sinomonas sp. JGH33]MEA5454279.1 hypothetical protein [Sinomonas sp. JGH33]